MAKLIILDSLTHLNPYIYANRNNKYGGAEIKKSETDRIAWIIKKGPHPKFSGKVNVSYTIFAKNKRVDEDNLMIYCKFINDGMKTAGVIIDDSPKFLHITGFEVKYDSPQPRIEVDINPVL